MLFRRSIIALMVLAVLLLAAFLAAMVQNQGKGQFSPPPEYLSVKTMVIPAANLPTVDTSGHAEEETELEIESPGGFGWSSPPREERERDESDSEDNGEDDGGEETTGEDDNEEGDGGTEEETTLEIPPPNYKIAFIGDSGYGNNYRRVLELIRDEGADQVLHAGDLGYDEGNEQAPQLWLDQVESILDQTAANGTFPYFFSMGNHDASRWNDPEGYQNILADRFQRLGISYTGEPSLLGAKTGFVYNGIAVVLAAPGERREVAGENHADFIEEQFAGNGQLWDLCVWHKNMRAMQVGGKGDETGWEVYERCREQGAIIATAHEHSYGRTQVLSYMSEQIVADDVSPYLIQPGQTFAFHSGLGGQSIRNQRNDIDELDYFARVYTADQNAAYGALFIEFNLDDDPRKARGYFKNINGETVDEFEIYNNAPEPRERDTTPAEFVSARGTELRLDGEPYRFLGFNVYGLANDAAIFACGPSANEGRNPEEFLESLFSTLSQHGVNAIRFWAFQSFTAGGTDFSGFDRVIEYAGLYNVKLIPVLENHWEDCTEGGEKSAEWYAAGYQQPYGNYTLSYRDYVEDVVERYKDEPTILLWQMMNEAESEDAEALYTFTADISGQIHSIDDNHLVSLGTLGTGQAGTDNENFVRLHRLETIDVVEAHDYGHEAEAWPSSGSHSVDRAWRVAQSLGKPFFIGEAGIDADGDTTREERAALFEAKIRAALEHGVTGYLIWKWDNREENYGGGCDTGNCVTEGDPVLDVLPQFNVH